jgi:hypothetical protein
MQKRGQYISILQTEMGSFGSRYSGMIRFLKIDSIGSIEKQAVAKPMCSKSFGVGYIFAGFIRFLAMSGR